MVVGSRFTGRGEEGRKEARKEGGEGVSKMGIHVKKLGYREGRIERKEEKRKEGMSICKNRKEGRNRKKKEGRRKGGKRRGGRSLFGMRSEQKGVGGSECG